MMSPSINATPAKVAISLRCRAWRCTSGVDSESLRSFTTAAVGEAVNLDTNGGSFINQ